MSPLDFTKLKDFVRQESARLKLHAYLDNSESAFTLALALSAAVKKIFYEKSELTFSCEPLLERKQITQFVHRMRIDAMEKFGATTAFSVVHLCMDEYGMEKRDYSASIVVYLEKRFLPEFLRLLQYPYIDYENDEEVKDGCGALANLIAGQYKREVMALGYKDLMMSPFTSYINSAPDGIQIPSKSAYKYEISFEVDGVKRLVVEAVVPYLPHSQQGQAPGAPKRILVIDDDPTFTKMVQAFLQTKGFEVIVAADGEEGIQRLRGKLPNLIILDVNMPNMNGYEFIVEMKRIQGGRQLPIIVLSAKEGLTEIFKIEGAKEYLLKPFQSESLLRSINRYI